MSMKRVFKWFWVWEFEKEDMWLNSMAADGWRVVSVCYNMATYGITVTYERKK